MVRQLNAVGARKGKPLLLGAGALPKAFLPTAFFFFPDLWRGATPWIFSPEGDLPQSSHTIS